MTIEMSNNIYLPADNCSHKNILTTHGEYVCKECGEVLGCIYLPPQFKNIESIDTPKMSTYGVKIKSIINKYNRWQIHIPFEYRMNKIHHYVVVMLNKIDGEVYLKAVMRHAERVVTYYMNEKKQKIYDYRNVAACIIIQYYRSLQIPLHFSDIVEGRYGGIKGVMRQMDRITRIASQCYNVNSTIKSYIDSACKMLKFAKKFTMQCLTYYDKHYLKLQISPKIAAIVVIATCYYNNKSFFPFDYKPIHLCRTLKISWDSLRNALSTFHKCKMTRLKLLSLWQQEMIM